MPLHNSSSYGHLDIAELLIKHKAVVDATDRWGFAPLHEAAKNGRTQMCALLVAYGADPHMKNRKGQTPIELTSAGDVICLLQAAMIMTASIDNENLSNASSRHTETGESMTMPISVPINNSSRAGIRPAAQGFESYTDGIPDESITTKPAATVSTVASLMNSLQLDHLTELFDRLYITLEILAGMGHDDLKQVGISTYGCRHTILKGVAQLRTTVSLIFFIRNFRKRFVSDNKFYSKADLSPKPQTLLVDLLRDDDELLIL